MSFEQKEFATEHLKPPAKILDLGAGDLSDIKKLEELGFDCEGVDLKTGINLEEPYISEKRPFDMVMSNFVLHFIENKKQFIKTAYDNLKDGGLFYFQDLESQALTNKKYLDQDEIKKLIEDQGFTILGIDKTKYFDGKEGHKHWHRIIEVKAKK